jgi:hypothetical protein
MENLAIKRKIINIKIDLQETGCIGVSEFMKLRIRTSGRLL